jgi:tetratricopeptide (TPR) repeat protein
MRAGGALLLALLFAGPSPRGNQALTYRQIVERYRIDPNDGIERMLELSDDARRRAVDDAVSANEPAWGWEELAAAAIMHTDAGVYELAHGERGERHLADAERLIASSLPVSAASAAFGRRWHTMAEAMLKHFGDDAAAKALAMRGRDRFDDLPYRRKALDAYRRGVVWELHAGREGEFLAPDQMDNDRADVLRRDFVAASVELSTALKLDPALLDAALHLGRIRMLQGSEREAVELLRRAVASPARPVAHLSHLFLGSLAERQGAWEDAEQQYRQALLLFPTAQSATMALSQLLDRRNRGAEATQQLTAMVRLPNARIADPWWWYFDEATPEPGAELAILRAEILK